MQGLLSVKWKLILTVVSVSLCCLLVLTLLNRHLAERYILDRNRDLLAEAARLEASQYNQVAENIYTVLGALNSRITAEFRHASASGASFDVARVAAFAEATLNNSANYHRDLNVILLPDTIPEKDADSRYMNDKGYTVIQYSRDNVGHRRTEAAILALPWWDEAMRTKKGVIAEPELFTHHDAGKTLRHVQCAFVLPLIIDNKAVGALYSHLCLSDFQIRVSKRKGGSETDGVILVSPEGASVGRIRDADMSSLIAPSDNDLSRLRTDVHPEVMKAIGNNSEFSGTLSLGGEKICASAAPIQRDEIAQFWSVILLRPERAMLLASHGTLMQQIYQALGMVLLSGLLGYLAARVMTKTLTTSESWYRTILDRVPVSMGLLDADSKWLYANPAIAAVLNNGNREGMIGRHARETMPERDAAFAMATNTPDAGDVLSTEVPVHGNRVHEVMSCRVLSPDGRYMGRVILGMDVTDAKNVHRTLGMASAIARSLDARAERILSAAHTLSDSAMQKSAAIEEITSTTQKIGENSTVYAESARGSHTQAESTHVASDRGAREAEDVAQAMNSVRDSGQKIRTIIKLIDDIAFQTNLLSLNAAVEAARAGRQGKGFAVVAEEVRNLAGRSAKAARETAAMIEEMSGRIGGATDSMEQLVKTLAEIKENAEFLRSNSDEVAKLADQQSHAVNQVHVSLEQISRSVNATIEVSRETAAVAESISDQAATLRRLTHDMESRRQSETPGRAPEFDREIDLSRYDAGARAPELPAPGHGGLLSHNSGEKP